MKKISSWHDLEIGDIFLYDSGIQSIYKVINANSSTLLLSHNLKDTEFVYEIYQKPVPVSIFKISFEEATQWLLER